MSRAIPVFEREQGKTYEIQRGNPRRRMLNKHWKQDPPKSDDKHTKLVLHGNQEKLYHWCKSSILDHTLTKGMQETIFSKKDI
jgi:hypothetical protein